MCVCALEKDTGVGVRVCVRETLESGCACVR